MKSMLAVVLGLFVSVASIRAASADAAPCGCGSSSSRSSDPGGGFGGEGGKGGATGGGGTAGSGGATGGGGTSNNTTTSIKKGIDRREELPAPCTEYAASRASNPTGELMLGMGAFVLIPLARRRTKKRGK